MMRSGQWSSTLECLPEEFPGSTKVSVDVVFMACVVLKFMPTGGVVERNADNDEEIKVAWDFKTKNPDAHCDDIPAWAVQLYLMGTDHRILSKAMTRPEALELLGRI